MNVYSIFIWYTSFWTNLIFIQTYYSIELIFNIYLIYFLLNEFNIHSDILFYWTDIQYSFGISLSERIQYSFIYIDLRIFHIGFASIVSYWAYCHISRIFHIVILGSWILTQIEHIAAYREYSIAILGFANIVSYWAYCRNIIYP